MCKLIEVINIRCVCCCNLLIDVEDLVRLGRGLADCESKIYCCLSVDLLYEEIGFQLVDTADYRCRFSTEWPINCTLSRTFALYNRHLYIQKQHM